ncbi:unnamed protein product, partial [Polarella glacialis]
MRLVYHCCPPHLRQSATRAILHDSMAASALRQIRAQRSLWHFSGHVVANAQRLPSSTMRQINECVENFSHKASNLRAVRCCCCRCGCYCCCYCHNNHNHNNNNIERSAHYDLAKAPVS